MNSMAATKIVFSLFCSCLAVSHAVHVDENLTLLQRFENLEARYESEIAALNERIVENEIEHHRTVTTLKQRISTLESREKLGTNIFKPDGLLAERHNEEDDETQSVYSPTTKLMQEDSGDPPLKGNNVEQARDATVSRRRKALDNELHIAFTSYLDHDVDNLGTDQVIVFNKVLLNDGQGYNNITGVFTAPTSGVYSFSFFIGERNEAQDAAQEFRGYLVVNGKHQVEDASQKRVESGARQTFNYTEEM